MFQIVIQLNDQVGDQRVPVGTVGDRRRTEPEVAGDGTQRKGARNCDSSSRVYTEVDFSRMCPPYRQRYGPIHTKETFNG